MASEEAKKSEFYWEGFTTLPNPVECESLRVAYWNINCTLGKRFECWGTVIAVC